MDDAVAALQSHGAGARSKGDVSIAEDGTVRRSADTSLESMLEAISARLKLFMARLDSTGLGPDGAGWLATLGMNQFWDQTVTLVAASASFLERPRPPMSLPLRSDAQAFDPTIAANSSGLAECLRSLMLARAEHGDPNRPDFIPRDLHTRLAKISAELDQHLSQLDLCNPEGMPPGLDDAHRLLWRIECVSARAIEVRAVVSHTLAAARRAEQTEEPILEQFVRELDRARWAYVNAIDDAEKDIGAVVRLIDPAHSVMLHRVSVELPASLDELRSWDLVARLAIVPGQWDTLAEKAEFPQGELDRVVEIQSLVAAGGWLKGSTSQQPLAAAAAEKAPKKRSKADTLVFLRRAIDAGYQWQGFNETVRFASCHNPILSELMKEKADLQEWKRRGEEKAATEVVATPPMRAGLDASNIASESLTPATLVGEAEISENPALVRACYESLYQSASVGQRKVMDGWDDIQRESAGQFIARLDHDERAEAKAYLLAQLDCNRRNRTPTTPQRVESESGDY